MRLEWPLGADEVIVGTHPCVIGGISTAILACDKNARGEGMSG